MSDDSIPRCILILFLVILAAFFAGTETAYSYCNRIRIKTMADDGDRRARRAMAVLNNFDKALVTLLIGNNVLHIAAASAATVLAVGLIGPSGSVVSTVVLTLLVFFFSETIPKSFARTNCDSFVLAAALPLRILMLALTPFSFFFTQLGNFFKRVFTHGAKEPTVTEDELIGMVDTAAGEGELEPEESHIIRSAIEFGDLRVSDVMTPRSDIVAISRSASPNEIRSLLLSGKFSRLPIYERDIDHIVGIARSRDLMLAILRGRTLRHTSAPPFFVSPDMSLDEIFHEMSRRRTHLAVVVSDESVTLGVISMSDVLGKIVGDVVDQDDGEAAT